MVIINEELPPEPEQETPADSEVALEFIYVPIDLIQTAPQIRKDIDPEGESIRSLTGTIRERGMMHSLWGSSGAARAISSSPESGACWRPGCSVWRRSRYASWRRWTSGKTFCPASSSRTSRGRTSIRSRRRRVTCLDISHGRGTCPWKRSDRPSGRGKSECPRGIFLPRLSTIRG
jgi:hypothetical protein